MIFKVVPTADSKGLTDANLIAPVQFDYRTWSREGIVDRIKATKVDVDNSNGTIVFSEDVVPNRNDHFDSKFKPYWKN